MLEELPWVTAVFQVTAAYTARSYFTQASHLQDCFLQEYICWEQTRVQQGPWERRIEGTQ